ncbi:MAG: PilN domain-containing protein [Planctomycetota bacterium]|nr:PilN domain-containing protein [Planctomycetota bacterium]
MSRAAAQNRQRSGAIVAVHDGPWGRRVVAVARAGGRLRIVGAQSMDAGAPMSVQQFALEHGAVEVVRVAPSRETLGRIAMLPGSVSEDQAAGAVRLLCDSELPGIVPEHRRGGGLVGEAGGLRAGMGTPVLVTGWLRPGVPDALSSLPETWTTPIGALSALANGQAGVAVFADRREGAISIFANADRPVARVLLEQDPDEGSWAAKVGAALAETGATGQAGWGEVASGRSVWMSRDVVRDLRARVEQVRDDANWLDDYAVAVGAAMLALDDRPSRAGLAGLRASAPIVQKGRAARVLDGLRSPTRAAAVLVGGLVLLAGGPIALAWARASVLEARVRAIEESSGGRDEIEKKADLYAQLNSARLPVTKLLMDLSRAAPVGVTATSVRFAPEQGLQLRGIAESTEQVTAFQVSLGNTRVFGQVTTGRVEVKDGRVEFDMTARITNPHLNVPKADDFVAKTLVQRLFPDGVPPPPPPPEPGDRGATGESRRSTSGDRRPGADASEGPPPRVSDADIEKMDRPTAIRGWTSRNLYLKRNLGLEAAEKQRIEEEIQKMKARADALRGGG